MKICFCDYICLFEICFCGCLTGRSVGRECPGSAGLFFLECGVDENLRKRRHHQPELMKTMRAAQGTEWL